MFSPTFSTLLAESDIVLPTATSNSTRTAAKFIYNNSSVQPQSIFTIPTQIPYGSYNHHTHSLQNAQPVFANNPIIDVVNETEITIQPDQLIDEIDIENGSPLKSKL